MNLDDLSALSLGELRDFLKTTADEVKRADDLLDLDAISHRLAAIPDSLHTSDSIEALLQLTRHFFYAARPAETLQTANHAARLALANGNDALLCYARNKQGVALSDLGRFAEATIALSDSWTLARATGDRKFEMFALWGISEICGGLGQWEAASRFCEQARDSAGTRFSCFRVRSSHQPCGLRSAFERPSRWPARSGGAVACGGR